MKCKILDDAINCKHVSSGSLDRLIRGPESKLIEFDFFASFDME